METISHSEATIASRIRELRVKKSMSIADLARKIGVAASTLREWEQGRQIRGEPYDRIANALGISVTELLFGEAARGTIADDLSALETIISRLKGKI